MPTCVLACSAKCTSCTNSNSSTTSNGDVQQQCTGCIPGFFLYQGVCTQSCPLGTFVSPQDNFTCTGEKSFFPHFPSLILEQLVPPLAVRVLVPPTSASHAQVVNSCFRAHASLPVLQIRIPPPVLVLLVIPTARPALDRPSTNATLAHLPVLSLLTEDVYLHAPNLNISTRRPRHVKHVIRAALHVPDQVRIPVSPALALLRFFVAAHVLMQIVRTRAR